MKFVRAMTLLGSAAILTAATGQFAPAGAVDVNLYFREGVPAPSYAPLRPLSPCLSLKRSRPEPHAAFRNSLPETW